MKISKIVLVTPVFDDWEAFRILLKDLASLSIEQELKITVFV